jgi:hypothetical protein
LNLTTPDTIPGSSSELRRGPTGIPSQARFGSIVSSQTPFSPVGSSTGDQSDFDTSELTGDQALPLRKSEVKIKKIEKKKKEQMKRFLLQLDTEPEPIKNIARGTRGDTSALV